MSDMKPCTKCGVVKPIEEFGFKVRSRGWRRSRCLICMRAASREHYRQNTDGYKKRAKKRRPLERARLRQRLYAYLAEHPCIDCGETDPVVLEFDHRDPSTKSASVGFLVTRGSSGAV